MRGLVKTLSLPRVQLVVLLILINAHFTNSTVPNKEPIVRNSIFEDLSCDSGESLVDTTRSILKMLLFFLDLIGDHVITHSIHHIEIFLTFEIIFILYCIKYSLIN